MTRHTIVRTALAAAVAAASLASHAQDWPAKKQITMAS